MEEEWRPIGETGGDYEVSNLGRVRNSTTGVVRVQKKMPNGYFRVHYQLNGKRADRYVHRLVADAFCNHPEGCDVVNHIDNNQWNNASENLEWTTQRANVYHGMKQGRYRMNAIPVVGFKNGEQYRFDSANQAGKATGCDSRDILRCCREMIKQAKGFTWKFAEVI